LISCSGAPPLHFREIRPKDFYYAQILRSDSSTYFPLIVRLVLNPEVLDEYTVNQTKKLFEWATTNLLQEKVLTVENWLEVAFNLCKQRWDSSVDWLELQPMSKVLAMLDVVNKYVEAQNDEIKKSSRRKR